MIRFRTKTEYVQKMYYISGNETVRLTAWYKETVLVATIVMVILCSISPKSEQTVEVGEFNHSSSEGQTIAI